MNRSAKYKEDFRKLELDGNLLLLALHFEADPSSFKDEKKKLPSVRRSYQAWYSEALACIKQMLPDRVGDFTSYYTPSKPRKALGYGNYMMEDYLYGRTVLNRDRVVYEVPINSAIAALSQQLSIIAALGKRLESTLFDIKTLVHADVLDDELSAAEELSKKGFQRGAGAIAGVVLEAHLSTVCDTHKIASARTATISPLNDALKKADLIDTATWRFIQHLGDIRNKCDHKGNEPTKEEVSELIQGVRKISKTVF